MRNTNLDLRVFSIHAATTLLLFSGISNVTLSQDSSIEVNIVGSWVINDDLSDNTDDQVEKAIEAAGGDGRRGFFNRKEDFYRGGPPEHELYDRLSYDDVLSIEHSDPEIRFTYEDDYLRIFIQMVAGEGAMLMTFLRAAALIGLKGALKVELWW